MDQIIQKELEQEEQTEFHKALLKHCKELVDASRSKMSEHYAKWDLYDQTYRGERKADEQDQKAGERGEPVKMVVPITYAQVQTFIAFCFSLFYQRERVFELIGVGPDDAEPAKKAEAVLAHDLEYNNFDSRLYQHLLDVARYGIGVFKTAWHKETVMTTQTVEVPKVSLFGVAMPLGTKTQVIQAEVTKFLGTKIVNVSPYRFFPDTRVPMSRFQEGEFVASEDEISMLQLKQLQANGIVAGVDFIKPMSSKSIEVRDSKRYSFSRDWNPNDQVSQNDSFLNVITEVQVTLNPAKFLINGKPMDPSGKIQKWNIWYANDSRIIKAEPLGYMHGDYTYDVSEYSQDMQAVCSPGLAETISSLQDVITWFINARVTAVRRTVNNWIVVDPTMVEMDDLTQRNPVIRLKPAATQGRGIDAYIKQLQVQDTTQAHLQDVEMLKEMVSLVSGINETALGQFASGRRSATEAKNVASAAAARLRVLARILFNGTLVPMAKKMVSNSRDGLDEATIVKVTGEPSVPGFIPVDKTQLVGNYDFEVFDGTLPTEKQYQAEALQEVLGNILTNPQAAMVLQYDPKKMMDEILELRGIRNPERFHIQLQPNVMGGIQQPGAPQADPNASGASGLLDALSAVGAGGGQPPVAG